jgi:spermidine synthase
LQRISSSAGASTGSWPQVYLGVVFTTLATLILELSLTRIFSVVFYYHLAFLAISIALFGLGAGGVFSYTVAARKGSFFGKLGTLAALNSIAVVLSLVFVITRSGQVSNTTLIPVYFVTALPFFFSGITISLVVSETIERVDRVYFFDLLGAAAGCLALVPFLNSLGGPNTVLAAAVLFAVSSAIWFNCALSKRGRTAAVVLALALVALVAYNGRWRVIDIRYAKGQNIPQENFSKWNSFSRIGLTRSLNIIIDADAATGIAQFDFNKLLERERHELLYEGPGFPYVVRPGAKTMIIGPGGGWDVARALCSGSKDITAVEINPIIANTIMREQFPQLSHNLYLRPEVHVFVEDGRSFVRRSTDKYQVLQATLVDTWASTAAGAFALSENNLYTSDAFRDYLSHLTDDGLLAFTRWGFQPPRESLRLLSLAYQAFQELGEPDLASHVIVLRENPENLSGWGSQDTVLIFRKPISAGDLARLRAGLTNSPANTKDELVYAPDVPSDNAFAKFLHSADPQRFWHDYPFDVSPVSDDRPFFFYTVQFRDLLAFWDHAGDSADYKINKAVPLLFWLVAISIMATGVILLQPPLLLRARLPLEKGLRTFIWYFVCLGAGYIMIQVALIQKFILLLGHPTYALTVIIFSMLISSGLGSFYSRRFIGQASSSRLSWVLLAIAALVGVLALAAAPIGASGVGLPLPVKVVITILLIAPVAFLMGMPFPTGLTRLESRYPQAVRWAWALNAASSVLGSAGAISLAIYLGLRVTLLIGGALYLVALLVARAEAKRAVGVATVEPTPAVAPVS